MYRGFPPMRASNRPPPPPPPPRLFGQPPSSMTVDNFHSAPTITTTNWSPIQPPLPPLPPPPLPPPTNRRQGRHAPRPLMAEPINFVPMPPPMPPINRYHESWDERATTFSGGYNGAYVGNLVDQSGGYETDDVYVYDDSGTYNHNGSMMNGYDGSYRESDFVGDSWTSGSYDARSYRHPPPPFENSIAGGIMPPLPPSAPVPVPVPPPRPPPPSMVQQQPPRPPSVIFVESVRTKDQKEAPKDTDSQDKMQSTDMDLDTTAPDDEEEDDDGDDDWRHCSACDVKFENEQAYNRHCRGMIHTQKVLEKTTASTAPNMSQPSTSGVSSAHRPQPAATSAPPTPMLQSNSVPVYGSGSFPPRREMNPFDGMRRDDGFYCEICRVTCIDEMAMSQHLEGKKHVRMVAMKQKANRLSEEYSDFDGVLLRGSNAEPIIPRKRAHTDDQNDGQSHPNYRAESSFVDNEAIVQKQLDSFLEPLIGLQYLIEHITSDYPEPRYICELCQAKCDPRTLISHLVGFKHRTRYLKEVCNGAYIEIQLATNDDVGRAILLEKTAEVDRLEGRARVRQKRDGSSTNAFLGGVKFPPPKSIRVDDSTYARPGPSNPWNDREINGPYRSNSPSVTGDAPLDEKSDFPYYSIRASLGNVRVTDPFDDFYVLEQGYYYLRRERNYARYDDLYVKPFVGVKKKQATSLAETGPKLNDTVKVLMAALAKVSSGNAKNGEMTLAVSTALTKALVKFKDAKKVVDAQAAAQKAQEAAAQPPSNPPETTPAPPSSSRPSLLETPLPGPLQTPLQVPSSFASTSIGRMPYPPGRRSLMPSPTQIRSNADEYMDDEMQSLMALREQSKQRREETAKRAAALPPPPKRKLGAGYSS